MFKIRQCLLVYLVVSLVLCTDNHLQSSSNATKPIQQPIISNTGGKEKSNTTQVGASLALSPAHNQSASLVNISHQVLQKPEKVVNKNFDKILPKLQEQTVPTQNKEPLDPFSQKNVNKSYSMTFNSQQPINQQWNEQTKHERQIQQQKQKEQQKQQAEQLYSWIAEEIAENNKKQEGIITDSFQIMMQVGQSYTFRWNPPKSQLLHLKILVLDYNPQDGAITIMKQNQKYEYIDVSIRNQGHLAFTELGNVYIDRSFKIYFDTDYKYFKLTNNIGRNVMLIIDLQKLNQVVAVQGHVKNDHFTVMASKLIAIDNQVSSGQKLREHSYKYQWGFLESQYTHDSRLLGMTGLQLLVIIAAAITQVYFIKSLLDNRAIV